MNELTQAALGIGRSLTAFFFVGEINEEFDDLAIIAFGDRIVEGMDDDAIGAKKRFVIDGVVEVAGEAGIVPKQKGGGTIFFMTIEIDHAIEVITSGSGSTGLGFVAKVVSNDETMCSTKILKFFKLLNGGLILSYADTIAAIGIDDRAGLKG